MTDVRAVITPQCASETVDLAGSMGLFRKQVLPRRSISYKGRKLNFDDAYLTELADNFKAAAFDQVPFLLADKDNAHTMDPERYRGDIVGVELSESGLDVFMKPATDEAADFIRKNPKLGVSARILEGFTRSDGKTFGKALQHVLGTLDPRINGMTPWQEVALSTEVGETLDLSGEEYDEVAKQEVEEVPEVEDPAEEVDEVEGEDAETEGTDEDDEDETELSNDGSEVEEVEMSNNKPDPLAIELANAHERIAQLEAKNARQAFEAYASDLTDAGVPPVLLELARPILSLPAEAVIELSNDNSINVADTLRAILDECKGYVNLSQERGHSYDARETAQQREDALLENWKV